MVCRRRVIWIYGIIALYMIEIGWTQMSYYQCIDGLDCNKRCMEDTECNNIVFNGTYAKALRLGSDQTSSYITNVVIYCPDGECNNVVIYSKTGLNQVRLLCTGGGTSCLTGSDVVVNCGSNYGTQCNVDESIYDTTEIDVETIVGYGKCVQSSSLCSHSSTSQSPTKQSDSPSYSPTNLPSNGPTNIPSMDPTAFPTKLFITIMPTQSPTNESDVDDSPSNIDSNTEAGNSFDSSRISTYITIGFIGLYSLIAILGFIDASMCRRNDLYNPAQVLYAGFFTNDMLTDIFFAKECITFYLECKTEHAIGKAIIFLCIAVASVVIIVIPGLSTIYQLFHETRKWYTNKENGVAIRAWMAYNSKILYTFTFLSGNTFSAIELCNSNLFSLEQFSMGLSMEQLQLFRNKRLFSSVLCEDGIQIILQIWFIMETHFGLNMELNTIALLSSIFSFISILLTFISYLTSRTLLRNEEKVVITFDIINDEVRDKRYHYQRRIIGFKEEIGALLQKPPTTIDILKPSPILNGVNIVIKVSIETFISMRKQESNGYEGRMSQISYENIQSFYNVITTYSIKNILKRQNVWNLDPSNTIIDNLDIFEVKSKSRRLQQQKLTKNGYFQL